MAAAGVTTVVYPVTDLAAAKVLFTKLLGRDPIVNEAHFVQYDVDGQKIGLRLNGRSNGMTGPAVYFGVDNVTQALDGLRALGATTYQEVNDFGSGGARLVASVKDSDGNIIGVTQQS